MSDSFAITPVDAGGFTNLVNGIDGFESDDSSLRAIQSTTLFVTAPTSDSDGRCMFFLTENGSKAFVPNNIVGVFVTDLSVRTQTYNDPNLPAQEKLILQFVTQSGEYWHIRCGLESWSASSVLLGLLQLTPAQLVEPLSISVTSKGRAVFMNVRVPDGQGGWQRVEIPREQLNKLEYDAALDSITKINQQAQSIAAPAPAPAPEPVAEAPFADDIDDASTKLDELIDEVRKPAKRTRKRTTATALAD